MRHEPHPVSQIPVGFVPHPTLQFLELNSGSLISTLQLSCLAVYPAPMDENLSESVIALGDQLRRRGESLVTAESCTGGWLAKVCTDIAGSSDWFEAGFVTYSNSAKQSMLGVSSDTLETYGAVSEQTVREMAQGAIQQSKADWTVAISGIAGPGGGSPDKPVGTVWFAGAGPEKWMLAQRMLFEGDREAVRRQAVEHALALLYQRIQAVDVAR